MYGGLVLYEQFSSSMSHLRRENGMDQVQRGETVENWSSYTTYLVCQ